MKNSSKAMLIFTGLFLGVRLGLKEICTFTNEPFHCISHDKKFDWNMREDFIDEEKVIGKGSFGAVKSLSFPDKEIADKVAVKQIRMLSDLHFELTEAEIELMAILTKMKSSVAPTLYGCQLSMALAVDKKSTVLSSVYLAQSQLGKDLLTDHAYIKNLSDEHFLLMVTQIIKKIRDLWNIGYAHSDIKPDNVMYTPSRDKLYLIDFNLARPNHGEREMQGTPGYLNPGILSEGGDIEERDDIYSWAITAIVPLATRGEDDVFKDFETTVVGSSNCDRAWEQKCADLLASNIKKVLGDRFGSDESDDEEKYNKNELNFLSLILRIIKWKNFHHGFEDVIQNLKFILKQKFSLGLDMETLQKKIMNKAIIQKLNLRAQSLRPEFNPDNRPKALKGDTQLPDLIAREQKIIVPNLDRAYFAPQLSETEEKIPLNEEDLKEALARFGTLKNKSSKAFDNLKENFVKRLNMSTKDKKNPLRIFVDQEQPSEQEDKFYTPINVDSPEKRKLSKEYMSMIAKNSVGPFIRI